MSEALTARNVLGAVKRHYPEDEGRIRAARQRLAEAKIAEYVQRVVASAPPLTEQQRDRLALLLRPDDGPQPPGPGPAQLDPAVPLCAGSKTIRRNTSAETATSGAHALGGAV